MRDPNQSESCFQGRRRPREGIEDILDHKETRLGDLCMAVGSLGDALAYYRQALERTTEDDVEARLEVILKASACLRRQGKTAEALAFVEGVGISFTGRCRRDLLAEKATLLCLLGRYGEAARVCEDAQLNESGEEREKDAGIYLVLGHVLARLCKWRQAIVCLEQAATFGRMCGDTRTLGNALNNLGIVYKNLCRFRESAHCLKRAVSTARQARDEASLAVRLLNLANTLFKMGEIEEADAAISECAKIASSLNIGRTRVLATICKARIRKARGDLAEAERLVRGAIAEAERGDDPRTWLVGSETLGEVLLEKGEAAQAERVLEECIDALSPHTKDVEAEVRSRLAEVLLVTGRKDRAVEMAATAVRLAEEIGDLYEAGRAHRCLGIAHTSPPEKEEHIRRAGEIFRRIGAALELGITLRAEAGKGPGDRVRTGYRVPEGGGSHPGKAGKSVRCLKRALVIFDRCGARRLRVRTLCDLALAYELQQRHEKAMVCLEDARHEAAAAPEDTELILRARARLDGFLAKELAQTHETAPSSAEAAFSYLKSRLNASALILARVEEGSSPGIIRVSGMSREAALAMARTIIAKPTNPYLSTDASRSMACSGMPESVNCLIGVRFGRRGRRGLLIVCWAPGRVGCSGASFIVRAHYEIREVLPVLEKGLELGRGGCHPVMIGGMLTADDKFRRILLSLSRLADSKAGILITGETGTGKELIARAIHAMSPRAGRPLVVQNCAALPEQLLESELFGHRAGAFTGARSDKRGLIEAASGGTFFLDEVGEISPAIQAKMLRAIETGEIRRVGDTITRPVDARFLSATNKNLIDEVERGRFRKDLFYRLNVVSVELPPLRERVGDVEALAWLFLSRFAVRTGKRIDGISENAMRALASYDWPGNVRQLENEIERAVTMVASGAEITPEVLSAVITGNADASGPASLKDELQMVEKRRILSALRECKWNKTHAARKLGNVSRPALIAKMKRLGIPLRPS
ncbi:MAG: sigma 54-interacting transcriptional regulator [bacterium]|jgi:transcriptional regulator with AAA-type ATPase domain/tetratricopeptide (TPR) repeat protein